MKPRTLVPLLLAVVVLAAATLLWRKPEPVRPTPPPAPEAAAPRLSDLAEPPDWAQLADWQGTVTRSDFLEAMDQVFAVSPAWQDWFLVKDQSVEIRTDSADATVELALAGPDGATPAPRYWRPASELPPTPPSKPLDQLHIAIDAGHLGGRWARIEERWFQVGESKPVTEGDMTLLVAKLLRPKLEALGAQVTLVRETTEPLTSFRPETLIEEAQAKQPDSPQKLAERLFYRTAEIRARAARVNDEIQPDLVLCLHFNAEAWGDPDQPTLVPKHHFHLLVNGAYTDGELALADQRFEILRKITSHVHAEEAALAKAMASAFSERTRLPPYQYEAGSSRALNVDGNPFIWARNLLANRLYHCPVVFLEPYIMNSVPDHTRIQAGDYDGLREVDGRRQPSIFREYADAVAAGIENYYRQSRIQPD